MSFFVVFEYDLGCIRLIGLGHFNDPVHQRGLNGGFCLVSLYVKRGAQHTYVDAGCVNDKGWDASFTMSK